MSEKPIFFNTPMVQAILDGRKTQTRRVCTYVEDNSPVKLYGYNKLSEAGKTLLLESLVERSRIQLGDILWVRETWARISDWTIIDPTVGMVDGYIYKADWASFEHPAWHPSIHMPRAAARIFLRVTDVRVEKVRDISEEEAEAEGAKKMKENDIGFWTYRRGFQSIWDSLYAKRGYGWDANPWVWVYTFERTEVV